MAFNSKDDVKLAIQDIEIGAVEAKDGASDNRGLITDANVVRAVTDHTIVVQAIDAAAGVLSTSVIASAIHSEDDAHVSGDKGSFALSVRADVAASTAGLTGDYAALLTDANGRLHVIEPSAADIKTAVEVMDDWDESDRAKVNPIVGQAGVAAGAGAVDALTQRVISATNSPEVTALEKIDDWEGAGNYENYLKSANYVDNAGSPVLMNGDADGDVQVDVLTIPASLSPATSVGNFLLDIPAQGATDRTQVTAQACMRVTIQAKSTNTLRVFIGGSTVTNQSGANEGIELDPGDTSSPFEISNCNLLYIATEIAGNDIKVFWEA